ncbi:MAG TPA: type VI secretion system-associated FHA domain protein TagH [Steroidobacteraceae bacterium]
MAIKLRVISDQYRELGENGSRVFGVNGGSVGRAADNDWILPDPRRVVSGHHFIVRYHGGKYWLDDTSTNGVFVNDADEPASASGRVELRDGDRLRMGDYDILVSVDARIDFLPSAGDEQSAAKHFENDIGHHLDLDDLLSPRDPGDSGAIQVGNAFGVKVDTGARAALLEALQRSIESPEQQGTVPVTVGAGSRADSVVPGFGAGRAGTPAEDAAPSPRPPPQDWAVRTRSIPKEELAEALARRQSRVDAARRSVPFHQQASTWADLRSAVQAFCRGAGIDPATLSPEAQAMLPLVAGQLLREAVVGLNDLALARSAGPAGAQLATLQNPTVGSSNPLRSSRSVDEALQRLFESHGRMYAGPVDSLRDVMQEAKDHEAALASAMHAGLQAVLEHLSPTNVADQFERGRARVLAPGQDPRARYWDHYADFHRLVSQQVTGSELPHPFVEAFSREYARVKAELRAKRGG